jgi:hypothetical protein
VIEAPKEPRTEIQAQHIRYPLNNIGGGNAGLVTVQADLALPRWGAWWVTVTQSSHLPIAMWPVTAAKSSFSA